MAQPRAGVVSVILVNFRGAAQTIEGVTALRQVDWPAERLEIVVVDNASGDGSVEELRASLPGIVLVESGENLGFAGGCNAGVAASSGEFVAFLNSDAKPEAAWISAAVATFAESDDIAGVASRVLDWEGTNIDFIDAGLTWFGKGYKPFVGQTAGTLGTKPKDVLFGTGSAMFVRRAAFLELGGFDEAFFMFYEDVDFGWRLTLRGWRFRYQPESVARHLHHGTVDKFGDFKETYFLERNPLFALYKNLEQRSLDAALPASLALTIRRAVAVAGVDSTEFDFRGTASDDQLVQEIPRSALASIYAVDQFVEQLPHLTMARQIVQSTRRVSDRAIWSLFGRVDATPQDDLYYASGHENLVAAFPVTEPRTATRVLVITGDPIGVRMAGPAIRAWHIAEALAATNEVILLTMSTLEELPAPFTLRRLRAGDNRGFEPLEKWADIILFQGHAMAAFPALAATSKIVITDIYDPMHLEQLEQGRELPAATWDRQVAEATDRLNQQLQRADFMVCASDRQRMFYLGQLSALGRINPANYADDPDLLGLLTVAAFGLDETPPAHERPVLKGVRPGIGTADKVLLWGGGLYNWFDPLTLIRAVAAVSEKHDSVRLFFQGTKHPHPGVPEMEIVSQSRALAAELGALDHSVFFNDEWVDYADRQNYLTEADAGVSTHFSHIETTFSFRTRILDYLWAGLPMVVTEGDGFAELVERESLGLVVPAGDVDALATALESVLFDPKLAAACRDNIARVRENFFWSNTLAPIVAFVSEPHHARDWDEARLLAGEGGPVLQTVRRRRQYGFAHNVRLVGHHLRNGGVRVVARKIARRLRAR